MKEAVYLLESTSHLMYAAFTRDHAIRVVLNFRIKAAHEPVKNVLRMFLLDANIHIQVEDVFPTDSKYIIHIHQHKILACRYLIYVSSSLNSSRKPAGKQTPKQTPIP